MYVFIIKIFVNKNDFQFSFIIISYFKAGIDPEFLTLAYEPEAAAIYCK